MESYLGQIQAFGFNFAPRAWALCDGQLLAIAQNTALFSLLGTTFGGDGRTTFGLPDLRGRSIVHVGSGPGLDRINWGESGGSFETYISSTNLPSHQHTLSQVRVNIQTTDNSDAINETDNGNNVLGTSGSMPDVYRETPSGSDHLGGVSMSGATDNTGGSIPFNIRNPFLGIYVSICTQGIFPPRSYSKTAVIHA